MMATLRLVGPGLSRGAAVSAAYVFMLGSAVHVLSPTVSGTNVIAAASAPFLAWWTATNRLSPAAALTLVSMGLLTALTVIAVAWHPDEPNARLLRGVVVSGVAIAGSRWFAHAHPGLVAPVVRATLATAVLVALLQVSFLLGGPGVDPRLDEQVLESLAGGVQSIGLPSFFGNANNFSVFAGLAYLWSSRQARRSPGWDGLALLCVVGSGSRTVLLVCVGWFVVRRLLRGEYRTVLAGGAALALSGVLIARTDGRSGIYAVDRLYVAVEQLADGDVSAGSSLDVRGRSHLYFIRHYPRFLSGSFDAGEEITAFRSVDFDDALVRVNPHSLVIELHGLFGVFGLAVVVGLGTALAFALIGAGGGIGGAYLWVSVLLMSSVPSSVLQFHVFYVLVTLLAVCHQRANWLDEGAQASLAVR